jgi:hypothetical protein
MLPHSGSMKLIMLSGLSLYIFSYTAYSAAILTTLSIFLIPIKTWSDLSSSGYTIYGDPLLQSSTNISSNVKCPYHTTPTNILIFFLTETPAQHLRRPQHIQKQRLFHRSDQRVRPILPDCLQAQPHPPIPL